MELNDFLNQFGVGEKAQLTMYFTQMKDEGQNFLQQSAASMVQYSAELAKGEIDQAGYMTRMQTLQNAMREQADLQVIGAQLKWQTFANQAIDLVAKFVISKIIPV